MKKIIAFGTLLSLCFAGVIFGQTLEINNSLQTRGIAGEVLDGDIDWGIVAPSDTLNTSALSETQEIVNLSVGYPSVDVKIQVLDFAGTDSNVLTAVWDGTPGVDEFEMSIPAISAVLQSNVWGPTLYTVLDGGSEMVDFQMELGTDLTMVDTYTGLLRISISETL